MCRHLAYLSGVLLPSQLTPAVFRYITHEMPGLLQLPALSHDNCEHS